MLGPSVRYNTLSSGNETLDKFLGGGLLNGSLNLFERNGPSSRILDVIINKSFTAAALARKNAVIYVNCNTSLTLQDEDVISGLPATRKVKADSVFRDVASKSAEAKIKIAWRYSHPMSPSEGIARMDQVDFGVALSKSSDTLDLGQLRVINASECDGSIGRILTTLKQMISDLKKSHSVVNVIIKDLMHPFSPLMDKIEERLTVKFLYALRCLSRTLDKGFILACYDCGLCENHSIIAQQIYNLADCVVSFYSYETDENKLTGYRDIDGTLDYIKVPKINSFGFHFQQDLSDWGYRVTKNLRYFVVEELSLPPCEEDSDEGLARGMSCG